MMMGRKKLKIPEMDAGNTPDTMANEDGEDWNQLCRKGIYALIYKMCMSLKTIRCQVKMNQLWKRTESKLAKTDIRKRGAVLKKQTRHSQINPSSLL